MERKWWTLIVVCVGTFMLLLDITIVNVALPKIATDLHSGFSDVQWVVDAYALTLAALLLTMGTLADLFGRRLLFSIGLVLFSLASLLCALSPTSLFLIIARAGQGIGGAIMFSTSLALLAQDFQGRERGTAFGIWGATIGGATAVGPLIGGALTDGFGWASVFYINVPIGLAAAALCLAKVEESRNQSGTRVDWVGTVTFTGGLFLLVFAVIRGNAEGWGSTIIVSLFAGAVLLLGLFLVAQFRLPNAMLDVSLFRKPTFNGAALVAFALSASMFAMFLYITLYFQTILGLSPLATGLRFLPLTLVSFVVAASSGNLSARIPARLLLSGGLLLVAIGLISMRGLDVHSKWTALFLGECVAGAGIGFVNPALASTAIGVVAPQRSGMASGINTTFRQVGIATGIAVLGAIFESGISSRLTPALAHSAAAAHSTQIARAVAGGGAQSVLAAVPAGQRAQAAAAVHGAFAGALNQLFLYGAITALAGSVLALVLIRRSDFVVAAHAGGGEPAAAAA